MATINIAFGGQNIGVEIPDIALESTMKDVLAEANSQTQILSSIAQKIGASSTSEQRTQKQTSDDIVNAIEKGNKDQEGLLSNLTGYTRRTMGNIRDDLIGISGKEKASDLSSGLFTALGLGAIGAQVGTFFGIMEEFGNSMSNLRRVGTGYLENLQELRGATAEIGLGLEQFGALVAENGITVRSLGNNTTEGSDALIKLTKDLRDVTKEFGYFGMSSQEMTRLLIDEVELKRRAIGADNVNADTQDKLVASLKEQLKLNEAMSSLTGQDIRDRIKASQQFESDSLNALLISTLSEGQQAAVRAATGGFSQLGPAVQGSIQEALSNSLAGVPAPADFINFLQFADNAGVEASAQFNQILEMIKSGADPKAITAASDRFAASFNDISNEQKELLYLQGNAGAVGARMMAEVYAEATSSGADSILESTDNLAESIGKLEDAVSSGALRLSGTQADMDVVANEFRSSLMDSIVGAFGGDLSGSAKGFTDFTDNLVQFASSEQLSQALDFLSNVVTLMSGAQGIVALSDVEGQGPTLAEKSFTTAAILDLMGRPELATAARAAGASSAITTGEVDVSEVAGILGNSIGNAFDDMKDETGSLVVNIGEKTKQTLIDIANSFSFENLIDALKGNPAASFNNNNSSNPDATNPNEANSSPN